MLVGNHQSHRAAGGWSARLLGAASAIALAAALGAVTPQPALAFTCDSVTNPAGGNSGANDHGDAQQYRLRYWRRRGTCESGKVSNGVRS